MKKFAKMSLVAAMSFLALAVSAVASTFDVNLAVKNLDINTVKVIGCDELKCNSLSPPGSVISADAAKNKNKINVQKTEAADTAKVAVIPQKIDTGVITKENYPRLIALKANVPGCMPKLSMNDPPGDITII